MNAQNYRNFEDKAALTEWLLRTGKITKRSETNKWIAKNVPQEKRYQTAILEYLESLGDKCCCWKVHEGGYMKSGLPDINAVICGKFFAFEVKRPFLGELSARQKLMIDKINAAGGIAVEVTYVAEVEEILRPLLGEEVENGRNKEQIDRP